jgi:tetratricopeptide (TPR) repeat protein
MKKLILCVIAFQALASWYSSSASPSINLSSITALQTASEAPELTAARKARDRADVQPLQRAISETMREAEANKPEAPRADSAKTFAAYLRVALFSVWLCEAIESHHDDKLFKQAAQAGVAAAEKAVALNPQSSEAHQLLGDLLGQLIPHVFGGGMRYGKRSSDELDKALKLNPKNIDAHVSRAISYYYSPDTFGGSKTKAFELLNRAVEIDATVDSPHIWLAIFYLDGERKQEAAREIKLALQANPDRSFTKFVAGQINEAMKHDSDKKSSSTPNQERQSSERSEGQHR